jgi:DNA topoisomerase-1
VNKTQLRLLGRKKLVLAEPDRLPILRRRRGRGFTFVYEDGRPLPPAVRARVAAVVVPPAWTAVRLADDPRSHILGVGRDALGRIQYCYHPDWTEVRDEVKAQRLLRFGRALPRIRAAVARDLKRRDPDLRSAAAAGARLIDRGLLRPGHEEYAEDGGRGAASLLKSDVKLNGRRVMLHFRGKSGKDIELAVDDVALLHRLERLQRLRSRRLLAYRDGKGRRRRLSARALNAYVRRVAGGQVSAKDFRTFGASAIALAALAEAEWPRSEAARRRLVAGVMRQVSEQLKNTPAVARSSYVHPLIVEAFEAGDLDAQLLRGPYRGGLSAAETALMRFLEHLP